MQDNSVEVTTQMMGNGEAAIVLNKGKKKLGKIKWNPQFFTLSSVDIRLETGEVKKIIVDDAVAYINAFFDGEG